jgi:hypothetical protein
MRTERGRGGLGHEEAGAYTERMYDYGTASGSTEWTVSLLEASISHCIYRRMTSRVAITVL